MKYVVDEDRAAAITKFIRLHLQPSAYNRWAKVPGQPIVSLYFDSPGLLLFRQSAAGEKNRIKLRIRFYDNDWHHPAFLEVKRRVSDVICKERAMISREGVQRLLLGGWPHATHWPDVAHLFRGHRELGAYYRFWELSHRLGARGMVFVSYLREAYESPTDEKLRVTLDRDIHSTVYDGLGLLLLPERGIPPRYSAPPYNLPRNGVVLEMKYDVRPPRWMIELVQKFNLERRPVSKFWMCMDAARVPEGLRPHPELERPLLLRGLEPQKVEIAGQQSAMFLKLSAVKNTSASTPYPSTLTSLTSEDSVTHVRAS